MAVELVRSLGDGTAVVLAALEEDGVAAEFVAEAAGVLFVALFVVEVVEPDEGAVALLLDDGVGVLEVLELPELLEPPSLAGTLPSLSRAVSTAV